MGLFHCKRIRYTISASTPSPGTSIRYDLAQLYQVTPCLNVPGTWYLSWKRSPTRNGLTMGRLYLDIECYCRTAAACVDIDVQYTISTSSRSPSIRYDLAHNFTKICTLLEYTWYLVSLVEAEPDTKWVDRGLIRLCLLYTSPSPRDQRGSRMPSSA